MIRFLTEDKFDSPFVKLFNSAYPDGVLYCAGSNTQLEDWARHLAQGGNQVIVYLDMVPDNAAVPTIYIKLCNLHVLESLDVVVMPIVCAEYAFIKSALGVGSAIYSKVGLDIILQKSLQYVPLVNGTTSVSRNFEKFCKSFCARCLNKSCCAVVSNKAGVLQPYFSVDCEQCAVCSSNLTLKDKAERFCNQYPVVPCVDSTSSGVVSWSDILRISGTLVDEYNTWCVSTGRIENVVPKRSE